MVSHSTKRRRRQRREQIKFASHTRLRFIEPRCDFWLVSAPSVHNPDSEWIHREVYGAVNALCEFRRVLSFRLSPFFNYKD